MAELVAKEHVGEEDLADYIDKVENLTDKEVEEVSAPLGVFCIEVLGDELGALPPAVLVHEGVEAGEAGEQRLQHAARRGLPEQAREVEHAGLVEAVEMCNAQVMKI